MVMKKRLIVFNIFNAVDCILTLIGLNSGLVEEFGFLWVNAHKYPVFFILAKISIAVILSVWIGRKQDKHSNIASWIAAIFMVLVAAWGMLVLVGMGVFYNGLMA